MPVNVDATGMDSEDDAHGGDRPKPGKYHVQIKRWDDSFDQYDKVIAEFDVLAGTVPGQESKTHTEYFATSKAAMPRLVCCCLAAGAVQPGESKLVESSDMLSRELIIVLEEREGKDDGKTYTNITWDGMYSLNHPAVQDVPRADTSDAEPLESTPDETESGDSVSFDDL